MGKVHKSKQFKQESRIRTETESLSSQSRFVIYQAWYLLPRYLQESSRDHKAKIADEIAKLKIKEPESAKLVTLEQELVRAEAENLVAEAQLTNVTRQKMKEAYAAEFAATIERAEKQIILARHGRRLLNLLDDTPVIPGDVRPARVGGCSIPGWKPRRESDAEICEPAWYWYDCCGQCYW